MSVNFMTDMDFNEDSSSVDNLCSSTMTAPTIVDVLIIGAGPAGLALANWFRNSDISVLLVDKKPGPTTRGQAEGLKSTTNEIFESFGIGPQVTAELWRLEEIAIWGPREDGGVGIVREQVIQDKVEELGKIRETMLQQSRVEHHMLQNLVPHSNIKIKYSTTPISVNVDITSSHKEKAYPVEVQLDKTQLDKDGIQDNATSDSNLPNERDEKEEVRAKYIVGCDGARSWLRKQLDVTLEGDLTDSVFGVVDIVPKSNFPDIRRVCYLRAATGTILLVPRSDKEVRLYIPVESGSALPDPKDLTFERIIDAARKIIAPYALEVGSVSWWSAYRVGQRVGSHFSRQNERAFLLGDAVHTHSPKAGQGMNTSVQDAYNLGWKLRLILQGHISTTTSDTSPETLLRTYELERRPVAQDLIAFDRGYLKLFAAPSSQFDTEFLRAMKFTTGLSIRYPPSCVVQLPAGCATADDLGPSLLKADVVPGKRLPDFQVVYQADGTTARIHTRMQTTGAFRLIVFAGDIAQHTHLLDKLQQLGAFLADPSGLGPLTSPSSGAVGEVAAVEVLVVHAAERDKVDFLGLPEVYRPWSETAGYDYWRVFADAESVHEGHGRVYERLEIDREKGRDVIVRPDGYVGAVLDLDDHDGVKRYFGVLGMLKGA
ncbi:FAD binding domain-containing protein [Bombardia bombarda]|uniref:FAD binding domain-containing protein n=1 Tax=Bombardia bombarda TaxID=252184 RepID=A0AA39XNZ2_9PEZI|nr:FAD binding domain-containing protein [Bombardia bombarda]